KSLKTSEFSLLLQVIQVCNQFSDEQSSHPMTEGKLTRGEDVVYCRSAGGLKNNSAGFCLGKNREQECHTSP
ncbi:MAG: hypothetical protein JXA14_24245, partial [Anaerolineae bacterium]|nr:hypothetical protein [Anaerolineae bacterium]